MSSPDSLTCIQAKWKKQLLEGAESVYQGARDKKGEEQAHTKELHAKIGELTLEIDFLSKALGR